MHISINLINIAAVATAFTAVLLSMPVVNATPMKKIESIFKPVRYKGFRLHWPGAFKISKLTLNEIVKETGVVDKLKGSLGKQDVDITCVKRSQPPHIVQQIYEHMAKDKITNGNTQPGRDHFADAPKMAEAEEMNCYITANTCVRGFRGTLGLMFFERDIQLSSKKIHLVAEQLSAAVKYMQSLNLVYAPEDDHLCFDANNKLLLTRYEDAVLLSAATRKQLLYADARIKDTMHSIYVMDKATIDLFDTQRLINNKADELSYVTLWRNRQSSSSTTTTTTTNSIQH